MPQCRRVVGLGQLVHVRHAVYGQVLCDGVFALPLKPLQEVLIRGPEQVLSEVWSDVHCAGVNTPAERRELHETSGERMMEELGIKCRSPW
jgi:hypothetical protein